MAEMRKHVAKTQVFTQRERGDYEKKQQDNFVVLSSNRVGSRTDGPEWPSGSAATDINRPAGAQQRGGESADSI